MSGNGSNYTAPGVMRGGEAGVGKHASKVWPESPTPEPSDDLQTDISSVLLVRKGQYDLKALLGEWLLDWPDLWHQRAQVGRWERADVTGLLNGRLGRVRVTGRLNGRLSGRLPACTPAHWQNGRKAQSRWFDKKSYAISLDIALLKQFPPIYSN